MQDANSPTNFEQAYASFSAVIDATKAELATVTGRIEDLRSARLATENAAPHTDAIVAMFLRGLKTTAASFTGQLAEHLKSTFTDPTAAATVRGQGRAFLAIGPAQEREIVRARDERRGAELSLGVAAVTYFLRDKIEAEIPALVDMLLPSARSGMKDDDRAQSLKAIDDELAMLTDRETKLSANLSAARATMNRARG